MTSVVVEDLHKAYGGQPVLRGIDLVVPEGQLVAILGPSGSGKTTLLRVLAGFERADQGRVTLGGRVVDDGRRALPPERRHIGYVPQEGGLFPHLTVVGNVGFGLSRAQRRGGAVQELLERVGLAELAHRYPHQLSGGQQQRVALARALAVRPEVVLLDEPFSALDAALRATVRSDVQRILHEFGATALLVTHDQDEALSVADLVAVIRAGRIAQVATPSELYTRPVDAALARFVGDANVVDGWLEGGAVRTAFGLLPLRPRTALPASGRVAVLVRPEQLELGTEAGALGLPGTIVEQEYYGHDAVVRVRPARPCGAELLIARLTGAAIPPPDAAVTLAVRGAVFAWPSVTGQGMQLLPLTAGTFCTWEAGSAAPPEQCGPPRRA